MSCGWNHQQREPQTSNTLLSIGLQITKCTNASGFVALKWLPLENWFNVLASMQPPLVPQSMEDHPKSEINISPQECQSSRAQTFHAILWSNWILEYKQWIHTVQFVLFFPLGNRVTCILGYDNLLTIFKEKRHLVLYWLTNWQNILAQVSSIEHTWNYLLIATRCDKRNAVNTLHRASLVVSALWPSILESKVTFKDFEPLLVGHVLWGSAIHVTTFFPCTSPSFFSLSYHLVLLVQHHLEIKQMV